ncbi:MAG: M48 family metallopeptidase [Acidobacteriota bacterium]|nr:M48 family metallopeptidase [Acidobacteriota bacterium]
MFRTKHLETKGFIAGLALAAVFLLPVSGLSQTKIVYHSNKFKAEDDVRLGRQAAQEAEKQMPVLRDREATDYVERVGQRLVAAIPPEFQHPEFQYYFKILNISDINAFALPGGPMYLNRGMIEAARNEGEMAGVMAHELSHVALRHGTAQATKAQKYGLLAGILGIGGQIVGGPAGAAAQVAGQGVGVYFLKFSREYETEADVLGAQIMARANYDPQDLANMFRTIERVSGGGGGGFLSDHPSPQNRYARINQEAQYLRVTNPIKSSRDFESIQARLRGMSKAPTTAQVARSGQQYPVENDGRYPDNRDPRDGGNNEGRNPTNQLPGPVSVPSSHYRSYSALGVLRVNVPDNWREVNDGNTSVWFVPEGGFGQLQGQPVFTHGINFTVVTPPQRQGLQAAMNQMINTWLQSNPNMTQIGRAQGSNSGRRYWLSTRFRNRNEATRKTETVALFATQLSDGRVLFISTVMPQDEAGDFQATFDRIMNSVQISE